VGSCEHRCEPLISVQGADFLSSKENLGFSGRTLFQNIRFKPLKENVGTFFGELRTAAKKNSGINTQQSLVWFMQLMA
jgi:hypothetical protein